MELASFLQALCALVFAALVIVAALKDASSYTIPNWIPLGLIAAFPVAALAAGLPWTAALAHLGVGAAALVAGMAIFALRWAGGGDAKLLAAVSLWLGWPTLAQFLIVTAIAGGTLSIGLLTLRSAAFRPLVLLAPGWVARLAEPKGDIPYGLAIAAGALMAFPASPLAAGIPLP